MALRPGLATGLPFAKTLIVKHALHGQIIKIVAQNQRWKRWFGDAPQQQPHVIATAAV
jgi:hypothetical protein